MDQKEKNQIYFIPKVDSNLPQGRSLRYLFVLGLLLQLTLGVSQSIADFSFYKTITIENSQISGSSSLPDFPVLFSSTDPDFRSISFGGKINNVNGHDILFTNNDGTVVLDHEIETYNAAGGKLVAWVKANLNATGSNELRIYFGSTAISFDASTTGTWNSEYRAVWHLNNDNNDATAIGAHLNNSGTTNSTNAIIGDAQNFDQGTHLETGITNALNIAGDITLEAWVNLDNAFGNDYGNTIISGAGNTTGANFPFYLNIEKTGPNYQLGFYWEYGGGYDAGDYIYITSADLTVDPVGSWHHFAVTRNNTTQELQFYQNGALLSSSNFPAGNQATASDTNHSVRLGRSHEDTAAERMDGKLDEVRISNVARSQEWITTSFNSMSNPGVFYSLGATTATCVAAAFSYSQTLYCETQVHPNAIITGTSGGVFSSPDGNIVFNNINNGNINLQLSSKGGPYDVVYTVSPGCSDTTQVTIDPRPSDADTFGDQVVCGQSAISLSAVAPVVGTGLWTISSGGTGSFDDATTTNALFTPDNIPGTYNLTWTVANSTCYDAFQNIEIRFVNLTLADAGTDQIGNTCASGTTNTMLAGNIASSGVGGWNVIGSTTGGSFSDITDPFALFTGDVNKVYDLQWTITNGSCTSRDTVRIFFEQDVIANAGVDQSVCNSSTTLTGNNSAIGSESWRTIVGPGIIASINSNSTLVNNLQPGTNAFEYTVTNGACVARDTVIITVDNSAPSFTNVVGDTIFYFDANCTTSYIPANLESMFSATDNCSANITFSYDPWIGICGNDRSRDVTARVTDGVGHTVIHSFTVTEQDTTRPSFTLPLNMTVHRSLGCAVDTMITNTLAPTNIDDNCDSAPSVSYSDASAVGTCSGNITITRTWTLTDVCGNSISGDQIITVLDTTSPIFTAPRDTVLHFDNACFADTLISSIGDVSDEQDNCSFTNDASYIDIVTPNCGSSYSFLRIWTLFDDCGNTHVDTQYVEVLDTTRPTFTVPPSLTVYMDITCGADTAAVVGQAGDVIDEDDNTCTTGLEATYTNSIDPTGACGLGYIITRTWSLVDDCGNATVQNQIITVLDSIAPVFTAPLNATVYLDALCTYDADSSLTGAPVGLIDNCDMALSVPSYSDVTVAGSCEGEFVITRTWTLSDVCGNSRSYNQIINVRDTISPTFTAPRDTALYFNANCDIINTTIAITGDVTDEDDNCTASLDATYADITNNLCGNSYEILRTWTLIDHCSNITTRTQTISVLDTTKPTYTIPVDVTLYQDGSCRADTSFVGTGFVNDELDNCSTGLNAFYRDSVVTPTCVGSYVVYRLWELRDDCNNINKQTQVITVLDEVAPTFFTPQNDTIYLDNTCYADTTLSGLGNIINVLENCSSLDTSYVDIVNPLCAGSYELFRTWTVSDECGNSTSRDQLIVVLDTISPSFTTPKDTIIHLSVNCSPNLAPAVTGDVIDESDNCTTALEATYSDSSVSGCGLSEVISRTWTLIDECGNSISDVQIISVVDTTAPTFIVPTDITVYKNNICREDIAPFYTGEVTTESDYCPGVNQATYSDTSIPGTCGGSYAIEREWTVTDACGNSSTQTQTITVSDTTRPFFTMPADRIIYVDASCAADTAIGSTGTITAAGDNCDLSPTLDFSQIITNGSCTGNYEIQRTWSLQDACGNIRTGTQRIEVRDNIAPTLSIPADQTLYLGGGTSCSMVTSVGFEAGYGTWIQGGANSDIRADFPNTGIYALRLQNNNPSSLVTSPNLNLSSYEQAYIDFSYYVAHMNDGETFQVQISNNNGGSYSVLQNYIAGTDFVDGDRHNPTLSIPSSLLSPNIRVRFRLFGDTNSEQIFIDDLVIRGCVFDSSCTIDTSVVATGVASASNDNCSGLRVPTYLDIIDPHCGNTFVTQRVWTIEDECGNINTATQTIEVLDTVSPEMIIPNDLVIYLDTNCSAVDTTTSATGLPTILGDNCDPNPVLSYSDSFSNQCGQQITIDRLWTIGDICGNRRSATQTITILDTISPILNGIPADAHFQCSTPDAPPTIGVGITATDNCDTDVMITLNEVSTRTFDNSCSDVIYTITRTWTATDDCGNSTSQVQQITAECECCNNGIDDDGDGAIDESDNDCPCTTSQVSLNCSPSYYYFLPSIWRMTGGNHDSPSKLTITTPNGTANYTIRTADGSFDQTRSVTQGAADIITLNTSNILTTGANQVEDDKGLIIESDQALQVLYQLDAFFNKLLITYKGEQALGQRFRVASQTNICGNNPAAADENHFISVMAAEDNTQVTFEFDFPLFGITSPHVVNLDAGETYLVRDEAYANQSVTGALVTADRPVAVVSGSQHTMNCNNSGGNAPGRDGGADQLVPTCLVGDQYVAVRGSGEDYSNYVIIVGITASTGIYLNGNTTPVATVGPGEYYEYQLGGNFGDPHYIRTDRPAYAYQVGNLSSNNEPGMAIMSPIGDCRGESQIEFVNFSGSENGVNVLVPSSALSTLELNGANYTAYSGIETSIIPGLSTYTSVTIPDAHVSGYNTLSADEPFIASQYVGVSGQSGTYGYLTSFKDEVIIVNPSTGTSDFQYSLDTICGGLVFNHCVDATSCAGGQYITDVIPGPHTTSVSFDPTGNNTCFSYIGEAGYDGFDEITVYIADVYGLITAICVDIYLCGSTPFIETIPGDTLILCDQVVPAPPVFIPVNSGCSQSYDLDYSADSTITYNSTCSDYAFTITRSWKLTDNCGNDTTVFQFITIADTIDPFLIAPPDTLIFADGICGLDTLISQLGEAEDMADNCDPNITAEYRDSFEVNPSCTGSFLIYRLWSVTDDCGNIFSNEQIIEIRDTIRPTFTPPHDTLIYTDNMCMADTSSLYTGVPMNMSDNCDVGLISSYSDSSTPGCDGSYIVTRTWRVSDDCGNYSEETQTITVLDTIGPELIIPSDTTLFRSVSCVIDTSAINLGLATGSTDNCDLTITAVYRDSVVSGCDQNFTAYRIWSAVDNCGNETVDIQTITIADTSRPVMTIPRDTIVYRSDLCAIDTTIVALGDVFDETDNCSLSASLQATYSDFVTTNCNQGYTIARTWTLVDGCGNISEQIQTITVADTSAPTYIIPRDTILYANLSCNANTSVTSTGLANNILDNCDTAPDMTYRDEITTQCSGQYDINRIWIFTDDCGNIAQDTQLISVLDTLPPEYITPSNVTLYSDINCYADTSTANTGIARFENDNCDLTLSPVYYDSLGMGCGIGYEVFRKWSVVDDCGNNFQTTQVITILDLIDPTFTVPNDTLLYVDALCLADTTIASTGDVTDEMDNCDGNVDAFYEDVVVPLCEGGYIITRTWTVQDDCGNGVNRIQTITVRDTSAPLFTVPRDTILYSSTSCVIDTLIAQIGDVTNESDACDTSLDAIYLDQITSTCEGSIDILRIWTLADDCGNVTIDTQAITVLDTIRPSFSIPRDTIIFTNNNCIVDITVGATGEVTNESDNCDTSLNATFTDTRIDGCNGTYTITRSWSLTDDCGNSFDGDQIIEVRDTFGPTFTTPADITLYLDANCLVDNTPLTTGDVTDETDGCDSSVNATFSDNINFSCGNSYVLTRTWTAIDDCGNSFSSDQTITVLDTLEPNFALPSDATIYVDNGCVVDTSVAILGVPASVIDNCGGTVEVAYNNSIIPSCNGSYEIQRIWSFTDACNNIARDTQRILVLDTLAPSFTAPTDIILYKDMNCSADTSAIFTGSPTGVTDNCASAVDVGYIDLTSSPCEGALMIIRRWTFEDDCGNTVTHDQNIEIRDTLNPSYSIPRDTTVYLSSACTVDISASLLGEVTDENDNCDTSLDASYSDITISVCGASYDIERTWTLTDDCGNNFSGIQTIHVLDTLSPIVSMPSDPILFKDDLCAIDTTVSTLGSPTAIDNCSGLVTIDYIDEVSSSCEGSMEILRIWTITDPCMNTVIDTQYISVSDTTRPEFSTPADIDIYVDAFCSVDTSTTSTGDVIDENDNCDSSLNAIYLDAVTVNCIGDYTIERTWILEDDCGNIHSSIQQIHVRDTISPDFSVPMDTTLYVDNLCQSDTALALIGDVIDERDNCSSDIEATHSDIVINGCSGSYTMHRTWTLEDDCGNVTSKIQIINLIDTLRPTLIVPPDTIAFIDLGCSVDTVPISTGLLTLYTDNCDATPAINYTDVITNNCGNTFTITRTWIVSDECGNAQSGDQRIIVLDTIKPTFSAPVDITIYKDANCNHDVDVLNTGDVTDESDNCDTSLEASYIDSNSSGCQGQHIITRIWTLEDLCGNIQRDTQLITVLDTIRPTFTIPADITLNVDGSCATDISVASTGDVTDESDNCTALGSLDASFTDINTNGCSGSYSIQRTWTLTDDCGNTTSGIQTITVLDNTPPTFTVPLDTVIYMTTACIADTTVLGTGDVIDEMDGCDSNLDAKYTDIINVACQNSFTITRNWSLIDDCNNRTLGVQTIVVLDTTTPTFTVPADIVLYKDPSCLFDADPVITGDVFDEADNCDTSLNATYADIDSSSCEGEIIITRTWTLVDDCGNAHSENQIISILDTLVPSFSTPADVTLYADSDCNTTTDISVTGDVTDESDNCDTSLNATYADTVINNCTGSYVIERTWSLNDDCGNLYEDIQVITVLDTIRPTFTIPTDITLNVDGSCAADISVASTGDVTDEYDNCTALGSLDASYRDSILASCIGSYTLRRMWSLTDNCGNTTTGSQIISVVDNTPPSFTAPSDTTLYIDSICQVNILPLYTGRVTNTMDGCDTTLVPTFVDVQNTTCGGSYTITRTWTLTDDCTNTSSAVQTIIVLDTVRPSFTTPRDTIVYKDANCLVSLDPIDLGDVTDEFDNCDTGLDASYSDSAIVTCEGTSEITRTWTLVDACGNTRIANQSIVVRDTLNPAFTVPPNITIYKDLSCNHDDSVIDTGDVTDEFDNCSTTIEATYIDAVTENCIGSQTIRRTWTLTDNCGNQYTADQSITVLDTFAPSFTKPADINLYADITCAMDTSSMSTGQPTALDDNCSLAMITNYADNIVDVCPGTFTIERTWAVSDVCGNTATQVQIITVLDTVSPVFTPPADATIYANINCIADTSAVNTGFLLRDSIQECQLGVTIDYYDSVITQCAGSYTLERRWEVSDLCGNTQSGIQTITVLDTTAPTFITPIDTTLYLDDMCYADTTIASTGSVSSIVEGCDNMTLVEYEDRITGVCAGSYVIERTWMVSDQCNNTASTIQIITVQDTLAPSYTTPNGTSVFLDNLNLVDTSLAVIGNVSNVSDNCSNNFNSSYRDSIVVIMANQVAYETYRFWIVEDQCGNATTSLQLIELLDTIPPSFVAPPVTQVDCASIPSPDTVAFSDVNGIVSITMTEDTVDLICIDRYTIVRTWTATDGVGNQSSVDRTIEVTSCNPTVGAILSDSTPCVGEFVSLNSGLSHPTLTNQHYPLWHFREQSTDPWNRVIGGDQQNLTFPAYGFRSGQYKVIYYSQSNFLDADSCQYHSGILDLNVNGQQQVTQHDATICEGETYSIGNSTFVNEGNYNLVYPSSLGCDSIVTLNLTVLKAQAGLLDITICEGGYYELSNGTRYNQSGIYYDSLTNINNCDSIITINLVVDPFYQDTTVQLICSGSSYNFNGRDLSMAGIYTDTLLSTFNCDSIVTLELSVIDEIRRTENVSICTGGSYAFDGYLIYQDTIWEKTFNASNGCDSIVTLELNVVDNMITTIFDTICYQEVRSFGNLSIIQSGVYRDSLISQFGCDSIVELHLHMRDESSASFDIELCAGESYPYKNNNYTTSFTDVVSTIYGCDSTITFNIQIDDTQTVTDNITLCAGDSILIGSNYIKTSGTFTDVLSNARGCLDSSVIYNITTTEAITTDRTITLCAGDSLLVDGIYRHTEGSYIDVLQSQVSGCDSTVTTNLILEEVVELYAEDVNVCKGETFTIVVDGADNLSWSSSDLLSCDNCPNPSGDIDQSTMFTATTVGCANQELSIDVLVTVFNEVQIEVLTPDTVLTFGESILLDAFVTDPFTPITWFDQFGNVLCTNCSSIEVKPDANTFYYAEANGDSGCTVSDTVQVSIRDACAEGEIIVPNFISPNGDGLNDDIRIRYNAIRSINKMRIFNRWGQLVFQTDDVDNKRWDGTVNGTPTNPGVYVYFIEYQCLNGDEVFQKGSITILK